MTLVFLERTPAALSWIAPQPASMQRASHALTDGARYWLVDPVDGPGLDARLDDLGEPASVVQLFDRHPRDGAALAERLGVPHVRLPYGGVPGSPFQAVPLGRRRLWREVALWWPQQATLVVPESIGTSPYYRVEGARCGVHPLRRLTPPRLVAASHPARLLVGHGPPLENGDVAGDLARAVAGARREVPRWLAGLHGVRSRDRAQIDELTTRGDR